MWTTELIVVPHFEEEITRFGDKPRRIVLDHKTITTSQKIAEAVDGAEVLSASVTSTDTTGVVLVLLVRRDDEKA